jgi:type IV pilus assembly protein PilM
MAKGKTAVGLDIGSSSVKLVQLKEKKGGYQLLAFGSAPLPPEAIVDGALMNSAAIVQAIQELFSQHKVKAKEVAIGVRGHSVIIKKISLPRMTQEELDESIQWEAEQYIPFDVKDVNIDTQILTPEGDAAGQMDVLLVAAKKDMINDYTSVCAEAGLTATVVDVDAFAVQNAYEANYEAGTDTVVLINVGAARYPTHVTDTDFCHAGEIIMTVSPGDAAGTDGRTKRPRENERRPKQQQPPLYRRERSSSFVRGGKIAR